MTDDEILYRADGRIIVSSDHWPEDHLLGDRVEGPDGSFVWDGNVWVNQEVVNGMQADDDIEQRVRALITRLETQDYPWDPDGGNDYLTGMDIAYDNVIDWLYDVLQEKRKRL